MDKPNRKINEKDNFYFNDDVAIDADGNSNLHVAAANGSYDLLVLYLSKIPENINKENYLGWTPLMQAARAGHYECVTILVKHKADLLKSNNYGISVFSLACASDSLITVDYILKKLSKLNVHITDFQNPINPLGIANQFHCRSIIPYLLCQSFGVKDSDFTFRVTNFTKTKMLPSPSTSKADSSSKFNVNENFLSPDVSVRKSSSLSESPVIENVSPIPLKENISPNMSIEDFPSELYPPGLPLIDPKLNDTLREDDLAFTFELDSYEKVQSWFDGLRKNSPRLPQSPKPLASPTVSNHKLVVLLQKHDLGSYIPIFIKEEIDYEIFLTLNRKDLETIGITSTDTQEKILALIQSLKYQY